MLFSVIIPTCHRNELLAKCLDRLATGTQTFQDKYEVIVTDDGSKSDAQEMLHCDYPWVRWVPGPQSGPAANRNNGAKHALGDWVVFIDDDCLPDPGLLSSYAAAMLEYRHMNVLEGRTYADRLRLSLAEVCPVNETGGYLWSCNFAIRKTLFDKLTGFDERFPYACMEDVDFRDRLIQRGEKFVFIPAASVCHPWRRRKIRQEMRVRVESLSIYLSLHAEKRADLGRRGHIEKSVRSLLMVTLPALWHFKGAGFTAALLDHFCDLNIVLFGVPKCGAAKLSIQHENSSLKLLNYVRPYWLREKLFWWFCAPNPERNQGLFEAANLEFAPNTVMKLKSSDIGHRQIARLGWMERHFSKLVQSLAKQPGLFVDVGANYGYFTLLWASASPMHRVVAFEASPRNLAPLNANIVLNRLESRVSVVPMAAGATSGIMRFQLGPEEQTGWGRLVNKSSLETVEVAVTTLDSHFLSGEEKIAVLKIDVEGADTWVIEGASQLLRDCRIQHIFFEKNPERMSALGIDALRASELLKGFGYQVDEMSDGECHAFLP